MKSSLYTNTEEEICFFFLVYEGVLIHSFYTIGCTLFDFLKNGVRGLQSQVALSLLSCFALEE